MLSLRCAIAISSSQVGHHATGTSICSSSHVARTSLCLLGILSELLAQSTKFPFAPIIRKVVTWRVHAVFPDGCLRVERDFGVLRWFRPVQSKGCLVGVWDG